MVAHTGELDTKVARGATSNLWYGVSDRSDGHAITPATCPPVFTQISPTHAAQVTMTARTPMPAAASARTDSPAVAPVVRTSSTSTTSAFAIETAAGNDSARAVIRPCRLALRSLGPRPTESRTARCIRNAAAARQSGSKPAAILVTRATGSPPRRRAADRLVGAGIRTSDRRGSRSVASPLANANPNGGARSRRPCSLTAITARRPAPAYPPSAQHGTPGSVRGRTRTGIPDRLRAHPAHHTSPCAPHPPHVRGRIRSSSIRIGPVCRSSPAAPTGSAFAHVQRVRRAAGDRSTLSPAAPVAHSCPIPAPRARIGPRPDRWTAVA